MPRDVARYCDVGESSSDVPLRGRLLLFFHPWLKERRLRSPGELVFTVGGVCVCLLFVLLTSNLAGGREDCRPSEEGTSINQFCVEQVFSSFARRC